MHRKPKTNSNPRNTPPITRHTSRQNSIVPPPLVRSSTPTNTEAGPSGLSATAEDICIEDLESQFLHETQDNSQPQNNLARIILSTPPSQTTPTHQPEETEQTTNNDLNESIHSVNLSGILNQTLEDARPFLQSPNPNQHQSPSPYESEHETFIESKANKLKSTLIIIARASHHKTFMETCISRNSPPKQMALWIQTHIYRSNHQVEKQWRDILHGASLNLTRTLIQHYSQIIEQERKSLEEIKQEINHLKHITVKKDRDETIQKWRDLSKEAEMEAKKLSEQLKNSRENKLFSKRKRNQDQAQTEPPIGMERPHPRMEQNPKNFIEALSGLIQQYTRIPPTRKGKEPDNGREYQRKYW